jgi:endonuclease YncB( thermonuclease family)
MMGHAVAAGALAGTLSSAEAETLHGRGHVIDGDTIDVGRVRVCLKDIAAPEMRGLGGPEARTFLVDLAEGQTVVCELTRERTHGRRVGTCKVGGEGPV